jgi:hypothetical protein
MANIVLPHTICRFPVSTYADLSNIDTTSVQTGVSIFVIDEKRFYTWNNSTAQWEISSGTLNISTSVTANRLIQTSDTTGVNATETNLEITNNGSVDRLSNLDDPVDDTDAVNKQFSDANYINALSTPSTVNKLVKISNTTGNGLEESTINTVNDGTYDRLTNAGDPVNDQDLVTKGYADANYGPQGDAIISNEVLASNDGAELFKFPTAVTPDLTVEWDSTNNQPLLRNDSTNSISYNFASYWYKSDPGFPSLFTSNIFQINQGTIYFTDTNIPITNFSLTTPQDLVRIYFMFRDDVTGIKSTINFTVMLGQFYTEPEFVRIFGSHQEIL